MQGRDTASLEHGDIDERDVRTPRPDRLQRLAEPARRGNDRDPRFLGDCVGERPADRGVRIGHEHARSTRRAAGIRGGHQRGPSGFEQTVLERVAHELGAA